MDLHTLINKRLMGKKWQKKAWVHATKDFLLLGDAAAHLVESENTDGADNVHLQVRAHAPLHTVTTAGLPPPRRRPAYYFV